MPKINEYNQITQAKTTIRESSKKSTRSNNDNIEILHNPYTEYKINGKLAVKIDDYFFNSLSSYLYYVELLQFPKQIIKNKEDAYKLLLEDGYILSSDGKFSNLKFKTDNEIRITRNKMVFEVIKMRVNNILKLKFSDNFINNRNIMISKQDTVITSKECNLNQSYYVGQWAQQELYNYTSWYISTLRNNIITTVSDNYTRQYMVIVQDILSLIDRQKIEQAEIDSESRKNLAKLLLLNSDNFTPNLDAELVNDYTNFIHMLNRGILVQNPWEFNNLYKESLGTSLVGISGNTSVILRKNIKQLLKDFYKKDEEEDLKFYTESKFTNIITPVKKLSGNNDQIITEDIVTTLKYPRVLKSSVTQEGKKVDMSHTEKKIRQIKRNIDQEYIEKRQHGRNLLKNIIGAIIIVATYAYEGQLSEDDLQTIIRIIMGDKTSLDQQIDSLNYELHASKSKDYTHPDELIANEYLHDEEVSFNEGINIGESKNYNLTIGENNVDKSIKLVFKVAVDIFRFIMSGQFNKQQIYLRLLILNNSITQQIE